MAYQLPPTEALIIAWHSREPVAKLAAAFGVPQAAVKAEWFRLKRRGLLPLSGRPSGAAPTEDNHDGRPSVGALWRDHEDDALLAKLYQEHPEKAP